MVPRLIIALALVLVAAAIAWRLRTQAEPDPVRPAGEIPRQLHRVDFPRADAPWLVVLFSSATCDSCAVMASKVRVLESADVVACEIEYGRDHALHERYAIDSVPLVVVADGEGVAPRRSSAPRPRPTCGRRSPSCAAPDPLPSPSSADGSDGSVARCGSERRTHRRGRSGRRSTVRCRVPVALDGRRVVVGYGTGEREDDAVRLHRRAGAARLEPHRLVGEAGDVVAVERLALEQRLRDRVEGGAMLGERGLGPLLLLAQDRLDFLVDHTRGLVGVVTRVHEIVAGTDESALNRSQHEKNRRQILYRDFIEEASKCYIDALQHDEANVPGLVGLYAKLSRMRVLSSKPVVDTAESITRKILDAYLEPDKSFTELRDMAKKGTIDLLREFSTACREEFEDMQARQF